MPTNNDTKITLDKIKKLTEEDLEKVSGGFNFKPSYQLYYNGVALPMNDTVAKCCVTYPELKDMLGELYDLVASLTLNNLCTFYGQDNLQALIDAYSTQTDDQGNV